MNRNIVFAFCVLFPFPGAAVGAQAVDSAEALRRVTLIGAQPSSNVRFRLVNSGDHIRMAGAPDLSADTLFASTPMTVTLPAGAFKLDVFSLVSSDKLFLVFESDQRTSRPGSFRSTFSAPVHLQRTDSHAAIVVSASAMTSERVP